MTNLIHSDDEIDEFLINQTFKARTGRLDYSTDGWDLLVLDGDDGKVYLDAEQVVRFLISLSGEIEATYADDAYMDVLDFALALENVRIDMLIEVQNDRP